MEVNPQRRVLALAGPTAVGKSEVALFVAEKLNAEIISVDSMQVYCGLDIGTAKPSRHERERVRHHLIDMVDVSQPFDAAQFVLLAKQAVEDICARGRLPILCGGTGLYFKAFFEGLGASPSGTESTRAELEAAPLSALLQELAERDPVTYHKIDRQNPRRVIRALEVIRITGKPYSLQRANWRRPDHVETRARAMFGLTRASLDLHRRIEARVDTMFRSGLVAETEALLKAGLGTNRTALQALGYRQVVEYLQGVRSLSQTVELVKIRTRQFAKRQMTWFRRQLPVRWIEMQPGQSAEIIAAEIIRELSDSAPPVVPAQGSL